MAGALWPKCSVARVGMKVARFTVERDSRLPWPETAENRESTARRSSPSRAYIPAPVADYYIAHSKKGAGVIFSSSFCCIPILSL